MRIRATLAAFAGVMIAATSLTLAAPAGAAPTVAKTGDCYNITLKQAEAAALPEDLAPVPCTQAHTFEVTEAGLVPADVNAQTWSGEKCSWANINKQLGINKIRGGVISNPLKVSTFFFYDTAGNYQCGVGVKRFLGKKAPQFEMLKAPIAEIIDNDYTSLSTCYSSKNGAVPNKNPVSISCTSKKGWYQFALVSLDSLGAKFPGEDAIAAKLRAKCPGFNYATYPTAKQWNKAGNYGGCYYTITSVG